ncbi:MAG: hypothetical protein OEZ34_04995, partial [Spirochaetia bacterium]|nr:hypothetical protein [Spirochaetia bacterium]
AARTVSQTTACGTGVHYYTLAYMQKINADFQTTALEGLKVSSFPTASTLCGADIVKFGIFNGNGFVADNLSSLSVPAGYPDPGVTYGVQAEFNKIGTAPGGAGTYDDLTQTAIDSSAPAFRTPNDPP